MLPSLQIVTFCLGLVSLGLALKFMCFFFHSSHHLSQTMRLLLFEQIVTSTGTLIFSSSSMYSTLTGLPPTQWNAMSPEFAIAIRIAMFLCMIQSTTALSMSILKVVDQQESE